MPAAIVPLVTAAATAYSAKKQSDAAKKAARAIGENKIDPDLVADRARERAIQNLRDSLSLEREVAPEQQQFRRESVRGLLPLLGGVAQDEQAIADVERDIAAGGDAAQSELLTEAIARVREELALGGALDSETRNEVARRAIARGGNTGMARFLLPRDLGLTSLQLGTERVERAGRFGQMEQARSQSSFDNLNRLRQLREQLTGLRQQRQVQLAGFGQGLQPPEVGLAPGDYASLYVQNASNQAQGAVDIARLQSQQAQNLSKAISSGVGAIAPLFQKN